MIKATYNLSLFHISPHACNAYPGRDQPPGTADVLDAFRVREPEPLASTDPLTSLLPIPLASSPTSPWPYGPCLLGATTDCTGKARAPTLTLMPVPLLFNRPVCKAGFWWALAVFSRQPISTARSGEKDSSVSINRAAKHYEIAAGGRWRHLSRSRNLTDACELIQAHKLQVRSN